MEGAGFKTGLPDQMHLGWGRQEQGNGLIKSNLGTAKLGEMVRLHFIVHLFVNEVKPWKGLTLNWVCRMASCSRWEKSPAHNVHSG